MREFGYKLATFVGIMILAGRTPLKAQHVSGHTRDAASGAPIPGAVVALLDSSGKTLARTISGADGDYRLTGDGSSALVRALRIGFKPVSHEIARAAADASVTVDFTMSTLPVVLDAVAVRSQANCDARKDVEAAFALWDQARDALLASVVAREAKPASMRVLLYDRAYERLTDRVRGLLVADTVFTAAQPIVSVRTAAEYQTLGFMDTDSTQTRQKFYLPVAEVLLDSSFVQTHCLSVKRDDSHHADELGLQFEPTKTQSATVDVSGVIWIARANPELRSLEFAYTRVPNRMEAAHPGGRLDFRTLPNGIVMSSKWYARIPEFGLVPMQLGRRTIGSARALTGTHEVGGEVAEVSWPDGSVWRDSLSAIRGHVVGDPGGAAIGGAELRLIGTTFTTTSDSAGEFSFPTTVRGPYRIQAVDTSFIDLGRLPTDTTDVELGDKTLTDVRIKLPSRARVARDICSAAAKDDPSVDGGEYVLYGRVLTPSGSPAIDAFVNVQWPVAMADKHGLGRGTTRTDSLGRFEFCGLPHSTELRFSASRDSLVSRDVVMQLGARQNVASMSLKLTTVEQADLPDYRRRRLLVTDSYALSPLADVEVLDAFAGDMIGKTNAKGLVSLGALPEGQVFLRLRKLGFEQRVQLVNIARGETGDIRAQLRTIAQLATVKVTAAAAVSDRALHDGFEDRVKQGIGHFQLPKDFDKESGKSISALVAHMGVRLTSRGSATVMSGGHLPGYCPVTIYVDGLVWWQPGPGITPPTVYDFNADDFVAAEYYASSAELPPQYNPTRPSPCGTLLLWRRGQ